MAMLVTGRGCPYQCSFCSIPTVFGQKNRYRSTENIMGEIKRDYEEFGIEVFDFEDEHFGLIQEQAEDLCRKIITRYGEKRLILTAMNGTHYWTLSKPLLKLMNKAGFEMVNLSLVSNDSRLNDSLNRSFEKDQFVEISEYSSKLGMLTIGYHIVGMPGQTISDMVDTVISLMELPLLIGTSIFYMTPGTPIEGNIELIQNQEFSEDHDRAYFARSTSIWFQTDEFNRKDIITILILSRLINNLKGWMDNIGHGGQTELEEWFNSNGVEPYTSEKGGRTIQYGKSEHKHVQLSLLAAFYRNKEVFQLIKDSKTTRQLQPYDLSREVIEMFFEKVKHRFVASIRNNIRLKW